MTKILEDAPDTLNSQTTAAEIVDKKRYAARWRFSVRTIDNFLRDGMPHLAIGRRRIRICVPEADAWMRERFFAQRRGGLNGGTLK